MLYKRLRLGTGLSRVAIGPALLALFLLETPGRPQIVGHSEKGVDAGTESDPAVSATERELAAHGDLYSARRSLAHQASTSNNDDVLARWTRVEDWYGSGGPQAYKRLLNARLHENAQIGRAHV